MSRDPATHLIIAFYHLTPVENPLLEVCIHKAFFLERNITSRIYISHEGINCQMSATMRDGEDYMAWMRSRPQFADVAYKIDSYHEHVFPRQTVKYRRQLVAFDIDVDLSDRGEHLSPERWKAMLDSQEQHLMLDVRNDYEWDIGRFNQAECPPCQTSRDFKDYAAKLKERVDPTKTPIMMYCTGGIRCEVFSALLKTEGFEKVYQLEGGVINYAHQQGNDHWQGKLFVFDDRLTVPVGDEPTAIVSHCHHCKQAQDIYYNCANTDCNKLFVCCPTCIEQSQGCCCNDCQGAERRRPYQLSPKPFKKMNAVRQKT